MNERRLAGLSGAQARERLERDGANALPRTKRRTALKIAIGVLREPMLAMLLAAGVIYLAIGDGVEASILLVFAGLSITLTIIQEARTERALDALRELAAPRALVMRDGEAVRIAGTEVVEDDLLIVEQGDRIAADGWLIESSDLDVDESLLTGESLPVRKHAAAPDASPAGTAGDGASQLFAGSIVNRGRGIARVTATGVRSRMGQIGASIETLDPEVPHLRKEISRIVAICAAGGVTIATLVFLLRGILRGEWLDGLLAGIATAMSLLPEEFPVVLTVFLAMGAWRIAKVGVLTRRSAAIEALGAATVLCADKTGTLTANRMTVVRLWLPNDRLLSPREVMPPAAVALLETSLLASAPVPADPMEIALHSAARGAGVARPADPPVHSYGLQPDLLAMSNVWRREGEKPLNITAKGAPEAIARLCHLDDRAHDAMRAAAEGMASQGMRILGVASAMAAEEDIVKPHDAHDFQLLGLVALSDPLRPGVAEAIASCRAAGVRVVMITGDYPATARAIAAEAGIESGEPMLGEDVAATSEVDLATRIKTVSVFARTMPDQKLRIVSALKAAGEIVAMTGDGVNDAPALKAAHVGIAMGKRGTDVAREAAAIVLLEDDFGAIVAAIRTGRRIYDNIRKALVFILAVHVPIAGLATLPLIMGLPVVLGPIQIALLEMVIDPVCALVFEAEREEAGLMARPPRNADERLFSATTIRRGVAQGSLALVFTAGLFLVADARGLTADRLRTLTFLGLLGATLALILANRSFSTSLSHALLRGNRTFRYVCGFVAAVIVIILSVPAARGALHFGSPSLPDLALALLLAPLLLIVLEITKRTKPAIKKRSRNG